MIIPVGFAQVNLMFQGGAVPRGAQLTFGVDNTALDLSPANIAAAVKTVWDASIQDVTLDTLILSGIKVKKGPNSTGPEVLVPYNDPGLQTATAESPQVAFVVTKRSLLGGRKNTGRWFLPAVRESYVDDGGLVDGAGGAAIQAKLVTWGAGLATADLPAVILHNDVLDTPTPIDSWDLTSKVGSQRRRLRKVGGRRTTP